MQYPEPMCECGHVGEEHDCIGETSDCLNTRCLCREYRPQALAGATIATSSGSYTSEPIPGVQSPFYAGDRYYANAEDARRARLELDELAALEAELTAGGDAAAERLGRRVA